ncbi:MAG: septum formation protein Maf [Elusimicrobia bacterium]|nr:septum formation protein Maf [Elusimicrobiota bacterium]
MKKPKRDAKPPALLLASASPRRRALMREHGYKFRIVPSGVNERVPRGIRPAAMVKLLALRKAKFVARAHRGDVVLGADTTVYLQGKIIGKPRNPAHARRMLRALSGAWQKVYTGVAIAWDGGKRTASEVAVSSVKMRRLGETEIERASHKHLDKAGGYAVQEEEDAFVERIVGDYDNVVGLPMKAVKRLLRRVGVSRGRGGAARRV